MNLSTSQPNSGHSFVPRLLKLMAVALYILCQLCILRFKRGVVFLKHRHLLFKERI